MKKHHYLQISLIGFFIALLVISIAGEAFIRFSASRNMVFGLGRLEIVSENDFSLISTELIGIDDELEMFNEEVSPLISGKTDELEKALLIKEWVMNQVVKVGSEIATNNTPYTMLTQMRKGKGASCGHMAIVYFTALKSVDIKSRIIQLMRSTYKGNDTHVTVEVLLNKSWVVIDPTFNCYFKIDSKMASAMDLHNLLLKNERPKKYEVVYGEKVSYPAELQTYYIDPLVLYNHVYLQTKVVYNISVLDRLPGFSYNTLSSYIVSDLEQGIRDSDARIYQYLVITYHFILPITAVVSVLALVTLCVIISRSNHRSEKI